MLTGVNALITGIATPDSLAFGIAERFYEEGANLIISCHPKIHRIVERITRKFKVDRVYPADLTVDEDMERLASSLETLGIQPNCVLHSVAYVPKEVMDRPLHKMTKDEYLQAVDLNSYSLIALMNALLAKDRLPPGSSVITMTFTTGLERVLDGYGPAAAAKGSGHTGFKYLAAEYARDYGINLNAVGGGPYNTRALKGIRDSDKYYEAAGKAAPLQRTIDGVTSGNVFQKLDAGGAALFFACKAMSGGVIGQHIDVDCGFGNLAAYQVEG